MLQRSYPQSQLSTLHTENTHLKQRLRKVTELQPYIQLLLQNNKKYQQDLHILQLENNKLRGRIDTVLQQSLKLTEAHKAETTQLRQTHQSNLTHLIHQLKQILKDKQSMQQANKELIEELTNRHRKESDARRRQLEDVEMDAGRKIARLGELVACRDKRVEELEWELREMGEKYGVEVEGLRGRVDGLVRDKQQLAKQIAQLLQQKQTLQKKTKQLTTQTQQLHTKHLKSQTQKSQSLLTLKCRTTELTKQNQQLQQKLKYQQKTLNEQNRRIAHLVKECDQLGVLRNQVEGNLRRNVRAYEELRQEYGEVVGKLEGEVGRLGGEVGRLGGEVGRLGEDNKRLSRENIEIISQNKDKTSQIAQLLRAIEKLQRTLTDSTQKSHSLQQTLTKQATELTTLQQHHEQALLENKSLTQKLSLYQTHNTTLEQQLTKQRRRNACLESSRLQIESIAFGALAKPEEICREYEREIERIVERFVREREESQRVHGVEIGGLRGEYEAALREKDQYFNRKIGFLEKEISNIRTIR